MKELALDIRGNKLAVAAGIVVALYILAAVAAPLITSSDPGAQNLSNRFSRPGFAQEHLLGTDHLGRDVYARIVYGARVSILIGLVTVAVSMLIGGALGMIAGYYGGFPDALLGRLSEILLAFPYLIFAIGAMAMMGPGFWNLVWALSFKGWVEFFRLARAGVLQEKSKEYVEAAKILKRSTPEILALEILPNIINSLLVVGTLRIGSMMVMEASLSFLGIGIPSRIPAWGSMIQDGYRFILNAWWLSALPGLFLLILVLSLNVFGEALREAMNPELKAAAANSGSAPPTISPVKEVS